MIKMYCDRCGEQVDSDRNGGVRVRTANRELAFHLCPAHQEEFRTVTLEFCTHKPPREVAPTLKRP